MVERVKHLVPRATIDGFAVQPTLARQGAYELTIGMRTGRQFGGSPVLRFGQGGTEADVIDDVAYAIPPLNMQLAYEMMSRTRIYTTLRTSPARQANLDAVALTFIKVSQMVIDLAEIVSLDINPLWADAEGVRVIGAWVRLAEATGPGTARLAIRPYPKELEQTLSLSDGRTFHVRPILPEDATPLQAMVRRMPAEDRRLRFFQPIKELAPEMSARLTQLDYDREMALIVTGPGVPGKADIWAVVRIYADPDLETAEYAIAVDRSMGGLGLGRTLLQKIIDYAKERGIRKLFGEVLRENDRMLKLNEKMGFTIHRDPDDPSLVRVSLTL
jgi:acetyltransferase